MYYSSVGNSFLFVDANDNGEIAPCGRQLGASSRKALGGAPVYDRRDGGGDPGGRVLGRAPSITVGLAEAS